MKTKTSKLHTVARLGLGGLFLFSASNAILGLGLIPMPRTGPAGDFLATLTAAGYLFPLLRAVEVTGALLLLSGRLVPLALTLLAPLVVSIAAFHIFLAPQGLPVAALLVAGEGLLAWHHRSSFRPLLGSAGVEATSAPVMAAVAIGGGQ